jgi:chromosome segregation and condensation protein ScpB
VRTERWQLYQGKPDHTQAEVELPEDTAWRLFTKGIPQETARQVAMLSGDMRLAKKMLETVAIIA